MTESRLKDKAILIRGSDLASYLGISYQTVYNYTKMQLLVPISPQNVGGNRYDATLNKKRFLEIIRLKKNGKKIEEIKNIINQQNEDKS